ncbi:hypothetical protein AKJ09_03188 [Labilithrix luteola]|uniref:Outer membrane protein beta-barrel domain-containing protein n=1 Tax=Labilithrix luteola TaxID=1391654 RepID=A0A0K1PTR4_9BACT|nr:hypothetical protein [Labilithrix luteola]AKU96524.1 hypothetical protein AKJ09_03188 [Labilithrix luteola]
MSVPSAAKRVLVVLAVIALTTFATRSAHAQIHWDASAQVGGMKRFLTSRPPGGDDASIGPAGQLTAHLALLPLVRFGVYVGHDISPMGGDDRGTRDITFGGLRAKVMSPWPRGRLRAWAFVGFGYAGTYARSSQTIVTLPDGSATAGLVQGAGGGFLEVPFGIGASYKIRKPWELCAELGLRVGFAHHGSVYEEPGPQFSLGGSPDGNASPAGIDRFALGLTVGVLVDM